MQGADFDEGEFFRAIEASHARALLIGRRAPRSPDEARARGRYDLEDIRLLEALRTEEP